MRKKIGIIGGAGPMASCLFYKELIQEFQVTYQCKDDQDFPEILLINYPFSPMISLNDIKTNKNALINELQRCFDNLIKQDCEIIAIACNTLHTLLNHLSIPKHICLRIDDVIFQSIEKEGLKKIALLCTDTTSSLALYQSRNNYYSLVENIDQKIISSIIDQVLTGNTSAQLAQELCQYIKKLHSEQAFDGIVMGCTEFSLLYDDCLLWMQKELPQVKVLDSTRLLAKELAVASSLL